MPKITPFSFLMSLSLIFTSVNIIQAKEINPTITNAQSSTLNSFDFKVSPNPAKNYIKINFNDKITANISILDGVGNEVLFEKINNESSKEISLHNLNSGIYFISVKIDDKTVIKRLIKY